MKKLKSILLLLIILPSLFLFTACGGDNSNNGGTNAKYNINFIVDEVVYATIQSSGNEYLKFPENPLKADKDFVGWFFDKDTWQNELKTNTYLNETITKNINVYAYFTESVITYKTVIFMIDGVVYEEQHYEGLTGCLFAEFHAVCYTKRNVLTKRIQNYGLHCVGHGMESAMARFSFLPEGTACTDPGRNHPDRRGARHGGSAGG